MKFDVTVTVKNYQGKAFTRQELSGAEVDGQPEMVAIPLTMRDMLESLCLNADTQQYPGWDKKLEVHRLLTKIHAADPIVDLKVDEIAMLQKLAGQQATIAAVGALDMLLENPVAPRPVVKAREDSPKLEAC